MLAVGASGLSAGSSLGGGGEVVANSRGFTEVFDWLGSERSGVGDESEVGACESVEGPSEEGSMMSAGVPTS